MNTKTIGGPSKKITITAMVMALRIVLELLPSYSVGPYVSIGIGFLGAALSGILLGPWLAGEVAIFVDIFSFFLAGKSATLFFPGYTLTAFCGAFIYGSFFYKKPITLKRIVLAVLFITIFVNLGLNSLWVKIMTQKAFSTFMKIRIYKNLISFPINSILLYLFLTNRTVQRLIQKIQL